MQGGDDSCFGEGYTYDFCCDTAVYGLGGNQECWIGSYSFDRCCRLPDQRFVNDKCWAGAASRILTHAPAFKSVLADEGTLESFCCAIQHNDICWSSRPEAFLESDMPEDKPLGFTEQYVHCCFGTLNYMLKSWGLPKWMAEGLAGDIMPWLQRPRLRSAELDAFESSLTSENRSLFCRFQVDKDGRISHCDFTESSYYAVLDAVLNALHVLRTLTKLPRLDFFVNTEEAFCVNFGDRQQAFDLPFPIFASQWHRW